MNISPWKVKKLPDDSFAYLVPDADIKVDAGKMTARVIVSTETMDRERDILIAKGCITTDHERNPIVLLNHRKDWPGIAQARDKSGNYTVKTFDNRIESTNYFNQDSKLALQSFRLVESGALRGVSPGFMTVPGHIRKTKAHDGHDALVYDRWKLVEITHCPIGMNPDALVIAVEKGFGGESLLPELKEVLLPFVPERPAQVTSGWDADMDLETKSLENFDDLNDEPLNFDEVSLTPSTQFYHAAYASINKTLGLVKELRSIQESENTQRDGGDLVSILYRGLEICKAGHAGHRKSYADQPGLPECDGSDINPKLMAEWRVKALDHWDDYIQSRKAVAGDDEKRLRNAINFMRTLARDVELPRKVRAISKSMANDIERIRMVSNSQAEDVADLDAIREQFDAALASLNAMASGAK